MRNPSTPIDAPGVSVEALVQALRAHRAGTLEAAAGSGLPPHVLARLAPAQDAAQANANQIRRRRTASQAEALHQVLAARAAEPRIGPKERVRRLRRLYDAWAKDVLPHSACRAGCSHCCHIGVAVSRSEAELIAQETRLTLRAPAPASAHGQVDETLDEMRRAADALAKRPRPCTFLSLEGHCRIYASRPLACRQLHNLDIDDLLCELIPGAAVPVPYADATDLDVMAVMVLGDAQLADIRDWFGERPA